MLKALDKLAGTERERAFEAILGVSAETTSNSHRGKGFHWLPEGTAEEDLELLREFTQALSGVMLAAERKTDRQSSPVALETAE